MKLSAVSLPGLAAKAVIFGTVWYFLPFSVFALAGVYFYFVPFFRNTELALPFAATLFLAATEERSVLLAIIFSVIFYLIVGIKNLVLINRHILHQVLSLVIVFLLLLKFFSSVSAWDAYSVVYSLFISAALFGLMSGALASVAGAGGKKNIVLSVTSFIFLQFLLVLVFLPLNRFYQSSLAFVFITVLFEMVFSYLSSELNRKRILTYFSVFLAFLALTLGLAQWGL